MLPNARSPIHFTSVIRVLLYTYFPLYEKLLPFYLISTHLPSSEIQASQSVIISTSYKDNMIKLSKPTNAAQMMKIMDTSDGIKFK